MPSVRNTGVGKKSNRTLLGRVTSAIQNTGRTLKFKRRKVSGNSDISQHVMRAALEPGSAVASEGKSSESQGPIPAANKKQPGRSGPESANQGENSTDQGKNGTGKGSFSLKWLGKGKKDSGDK